MRYGLITPVVTFNPRMASDWERAAGLDELLAIAGTADRLGYHHLTASEHVAIPESASGQRGRRYWDPGVTLGYLAGRTQRIRLATYVLVLGYHHPLEIVKRFGTLDVVSRGRLILGVGVGSLEEEFRLLGVPFAGRGERANDAIRAIRASLGQPAPEYHGTHYDFGGMTVDPLTVQAHVPIWIGGRSARSLRRAVELDADAWVPFALGPREVEPMLARARERESWQRRERPLDIGLPVEPALDPQGNPQQVRDRIERYRNAGATILNLRFSSRSLAHLLEQLAAFVEIAGPSD